MRATRKLHINLTRTEDTVNRVLAEMAKGNYIHESLPEVALPEAIDVLNVTPEI